MKGRNSCVCELSVISLARQFSRTLTSYVYLRRSRRKSGQFNAYVTSTGRPETPSRFSDIEGIFRKENSTVTPSRSTLRRHMFVPLCLFILARLSSSSRDAFFPSILWAGSLSLARTLPTPLAKGSSGAWSILLMAHTRVVVDLGLKDRAAPPLLYKRI